MGTRTHSPGEYNVLSNIGQRYVTRRAGEFYQLRHRTRSVTASAYDTVACNMNAEKYHEVKQLFCRE